MTVPLAMTAFTLPCKPNSNVESRVSMCGVGQLQEDFQATWKLAGGGGNIRILDDVFSFSEANILGELFDSRQRHHYCRCMDIFSVDIPSQKMEWGVQPLLTWDYIIMIVSAEACEQIRGANIVDFDVFIASNNVMSLS